MNADDKPKRVHKGTNAIEELISEYALVPHLIRNLYQNSESFLKLPSKDKLKTYNRIEKAEDLYKYAYSLHHDKKKIQMASNYYESVLIRHPHSKYAAYANQQLENIKLATNFSKNSIKIEKIEDPTKNNVINDFDPEKWTRQNVFGYDKERQSTWIKISSLIKIIIFEKLMSLKENLVLLITALMLLISFLFPPFISTVRSKNFIGYWFLLNPPGSLVKIYTDLLTVQCLVIVIAGLLVWLALRSFNQKR